MEGEISKSDAMNGKDKVDVLLKLAEFADKRFASRKEFEWRVNLLCWGLLVALTFAHIEKGVPTPWPIYVVALIAYVFLWVRGIWAANKVDKDLMLHYINAV